MEQWQVSESEGELRKPGSLFIYSDINEVLLQEQT